MSDLKRRSAPLARPALARAAPVTERDDVLGVAMAAIAAMALASAWRSSGPDGSGGSASVPGWDPGPAGGRGMGMEYLLAKGPKRNAAPCSRILPPRPLARSAEKPREQPSVQRHPGSLEPTFIGSGL